MELDKQLLDSLYESIKKGKITLNQAPEPYQEELQARLNENG